MPPLNPVIDEVLWKLLHKYVYGADPPPTVTLAVPFAAPWQFTFVPVTLDVKAAGSVTV